MYLFPPRPEQTTKNTELDKYDNGLYIGQPKYNGTCANLFMNETETIFMNRHKEVIKAGDYSKVDFRGLYSGKGWMVLCGEWLNKNKKGEDGNPFNLKFILWDILVYNGEYLLGKTMTERLALLEELYPCCKMVVNEKGMLAYSHLCITKFNNVFKSPTYYNNFSLLYDSLVKTDLYEGIVLKRKDAKLTVGMSEKNNNTWQIKCRKETRNYSF